MRNEGLPLRAVQKVISGASVAAATLTRTIPASATMLHFCEGFDITFAGATAASVVEVTLSGLLGGTLTFILTVPAGATVAGTPLCVKFPKPIPATDKNIAVTLTVPSLGAGNTKANANLYGFCIPA